MIWYVSYGSNLLAERFHTYLTGSDAASEFGAHRPSPNPSLPQRETWLWIDYPLYFAGISQRWTGSAAFVSLDPDIANPSLAHGYLIDTEQFAHLMAIENVVDRVDVELPRTPGSWSKMRIDQRGETFRGKYDALLRLPDIDGTPAMTFTSSIVREKGVPAERYLATIRRGLESSPLPVDTDSYLDAAVARRR